MAKYRKVDTKIWNDNRFRELWVNKWEEPSICLNSYPWPMRSLPERQILCIQRRNRFRKIIKKIKVEVFKKFKNKCAVCKTKENLILDHVIPIRWGGTNDKFNFQILCGLCNLKKGGKLPILTKKQEATL